MNSNMKNHYYVSVSGKSIETEPSLSEQLQILATEEELQKLQTLLDHQQHDDELTHIRAPLPYKSNDHDPANDQFTEHLIEVYRAIYRVGTEETRDHIRSMNIIGELHNTDYNYPGYEDK
ncbi:hypothetical protein [Paenibacillus abyssi]|uniref:Hydrolase n=1 Tax=Paenibacillus abyssi TaxID=1340531 RepID=A0A917CJT8_9BACL|nr:hypothetical protein [Paenibacillus abyssi]GGF91098.1 hypothetical protein GCM10010916_05480 [Paenibacillus abyssi]